jgi:hypothetical protein
MKFVVTLLLFVGLVLVVHGTPPQATHRPTTATTTKLKLEEEMEKCKTEQDIMTDPECKDQEKIWAANTGSTTTYKPKLAAPAPATVKATSQKPAEGKSPSLESGKHEAGRKRREDTTTTTTERPRSHDWVYYREKLKEKLYERLIDKSFGLFL